MKPTRRLRRAKHCTRWKTAFTLRRTARAGRGSTKFTGRVGKKVLKPGRHRFVLTATDAQGARSAPRKLSFRIVKR